jgi:hypothetical protein
LNIKYKILQHGYPLQQTGYLPVENLIVYDKASFDIFKQWGIKNIEQKFDLFNINLSNINTDNNEILICLTSNANENIIIYNYLKYYFDNNNNVNLKFRVRKHPGSHFLPLTIFDFFNLHKNNFSYDKFTDSRESILNSKLIISYFSSILQEASELNKPILLLQDLEYWSHCNFKNIIYINDNETFYEQINKFTNYS